MPYFGREAWRRLDLNVNVKLISYYQTVYGVAVWVTFIVLLLSFFCLASKLKIRYNLSHFVDIQYQCKQQNHYIGYDPKLSLDNYLTEIRI